MSEGVAVLEISALGAALVILDTVDKAAPVRVLQAELNDYYGYVVKICGDAASLQTAAEVARSTAAAMQSKFVASVIESPAPRAWTAIQTPVEFQPLIEQNVVFEPSSEFPRSAKKSPRITPMSTPESFAVGLIETQGFTAVIAAIDTACKAGDVEVLGKEKLGGGYITVLIKGDVAAVTAAVEAGKAKVPALGNLIAAHVIPRPSAAVLELLPKI